MRVRKDQRTVSHVADAPPVAIRIRDVRRRSIAGTAAAQEAGDMRWFFGRGGAHVQQTATCAPTRAGRAASHGCRLPAGCARERSAAQGGERSNMSHIAVERRRTTRRAPWISLVWGVGMKGLPGNGVGRYPAAASRKRAQGVGRYPRSGDVSDRYMTVTRPLWAAC